MRTSVITLLYSFIYYQLLSPKIKSFPWIIYYSKFGLLGLVCCFSEMMKRDHRFRNASFQAEHISGEKKLTPKGNFLTSGITMTIPYYKLTAEYLSIKRGFFFLDFFFWKKIPLQITIIWKDSWICPRTCFT